MVGEWKVCFDLFVFENAWTTSLYTSLYAIPHLLDSGIWFLLKSRCGKERLGWDISPFFQGRQEKRVYSTPLRHA